MSLRPWVGEEPVKVESIKDTYASRRFLYYNETATGDTMQTAFTVPNGMAWRLKSVYASLVDVNAADVRQIQVALWTPYRSTNAAYALYASTAQAALETRLVMFLPGAQQDLRTSGTYRTETIPIGEHDLLPNDFIALTAYNCAAGDALGAVVQVEEYRYG